MLIRRIVTALVFGLAIIAALFVLPSLWAGVLLGAVWLIGAHEWSTFARLEAPGRAAFVLFNAVLMIAATRLLGVDGYVPLVLGVALIWWVAAFILLFKWPCALSKGFTLLAGIATLVPAWALLAWLHSASADGPQRVLQLFVIVWAADSGAYFCGRRFGRHKLAPQISPGKTWEGVFGGLITAGVIGAFAAYLSNVPIVASTAVAALTAGVSVLGDLNVSLFKRHAGLKDSGRLLPGHGGLLDRADSVTAAVAMFVLGLTLVGIIT